MKRVIFIGNRTGILEVLLNQPQNFKVIYIYGLKDSYLAQGISQFHTQYEIFTSADKKRICHNLFEGEFDLLISNGCPFLLPISSLQKPNRLFINVHPTFLPFLRGKTPINGIFYNEMSFFGATAHFMNDQIDKGNIICQLKKDLTIDIDLGLLYYLSFQLEKDVFLKAIEILEDNNFNYEGVVQKEIGSVFNRKDDMMIVNFDTMSNREIITRVKSFGVLTQGVTGCIEGKEFKIFEVEAISNYYLLQKFHISLPNTILLNYDNKFLVKTLDGILKIKSFLEL